MSIIAITTSLSFPEKEIKQNNKIMYTLCKKSEHFHSVTIFHFIKSSREISSWSALRPSLDGIVDDETVLEIKCLYTE